MGFFRSKRLFPAIQWRGDNLAEVASFLSDIGQEWVLFIDKYGYLEMSEHLEDATLEFEQDEYRIEKGEWIVIYEKKLFEIMNASNFAKCFEPVEKSIEVTS